MHQAIPYLLTGLGGAALPSIAVPVIHSNLSETNRKLEGELNKYTGKISKPTQNDLRDLLNNNFQNSPSDWTDGTSKLDSSGISLSGTSNVKCSCFIYNSDNGTGNYTYYLCRKVDSGG